MKKNLLIALILCSVPIGLLGCSDKQSEQVNNENVQSELNGNKEDIKGDSSEKAEGSFYLYKDCVDDYNNPPNLIGDVKSDLKFKLDTDMSKNGFSIYNGGITEKDFDNITNFKQIEDIFAKERSFPSEKYLIEINLDKIISDPNIVLSRAKDIGNWIPKQEFKLTYNAKESTSSEMDQWHDHAIVISKLDGLALNSTEETKFKLLNYMVDNLGNIESLETREEVLQYIYLNAYLQTAFREADPILIKVLYNLKVTLKNQLNLIDELNDPNSEEFSIDTSKSLVRGYLELVYRDLKLVSKLA